jgi:hypothetical protein
MDKEPESQIKQFFNLESVIGDWVKTRFLRKTWFFSETLKETEWR